METIVYDGLSVEMLPEHGGRVTRVDPASVPPVPGPAMGRRAPADVEPFVGRQVEVAAARAAAPGAPVEFHAGCGYGKSALLRHIAAQWTAHGSIPVVHLRVRGYPAGDVRQAIVEALHPTDRRVRHTTQECARLLADSSATILLDDVTLDPAALKAVVDEMPGCTVVIGCDRPLLGPAGRSVALAGLPLDAARDLLCADLGRTLRDEERLDAERLWAAVDGQPLHLRQAAALVRDGGHHLADLVSAVGRDRYALDRLSINALPNPQRRALALLAFAAGALLPTDLIAAITDLADIWAILTSLHGRGLIERDDDQFGLPVCLAKDYRALLVDSLALGNAVRVLVDWIRQHDSGSPDAVAVADAALSLIRYAAERANWPTMVRLVDAVEPVLALAGRWDTWSDVLHLGLTAARRIADLTVQARFEHQLGVFEFTTGHPSTAYAHWQEALRIRTEVGDRTGAAVTRANLDVQAPPVAVPSSPPSGRAARHLLLRSKGGLIGAAAGVALAVAISAAVASNLGPEPSGAGPVSPTVVTNSAGITTPSSDPSQGGPTSGGVESGGSSPGGGPGGSSPGGGGVTAPRASATATVAPTSYTGTDCPQTFTFTGTISVTSGPITVRYRWFGSDGGTLPDQTLTFTGSGAQQQSVQPTTWTLSANGTRWQAIQILSPNTTQSNHATFTLTCQTGPTVSATAAVSPTSYTGTDCPHTFTFTGTIRVTSGPITVRYRWFGSDGGTLPDQTLTFTGSGVQQQSVQPTTWTLSANGTRWQAIQILSPNTTQSNHATFTLTCQPPG
jgi:hypothetical protein